MKIRKCILLNLIICCSLIYSGCISTKNMRKETNVELHQLSKEFLDGDYLVNEKDKEKEVLSLWHMLSSSYRGKLKEVEIKDGMYVKLELTHPNLLNAKLLQGITILDEINLKGKVENNYFSIKRKYFLLPIPFLFVYIDTKNLIGNSKDGNLLIINGDKSYGWILIMAAGQGDITQHQYQKSKQSLNIE